ncbi:MAG: phenylalanine 4-monooxygenase, partial [Pyrinomonadaceae bacterium]|nr:phenylalanine 4-monooxygenase [Sphingobacteriaceae bacterium]
MRTISVFQEYDVYTKEDHKTWAILTKRGRKLHTGKISKEYLNGFEQLRLDQERIIKIDEISERLKSITGWSLIPVSGLIPTRDFFFMLLNKKYPITVSIRKPCEIDFSEQPDIFHDVFGHLPLLTNEKFLKFLTAYSIIAFKYVNNEKAIDFLGRLYWYTYEMGIINEDGENKPYGGAIITSAGEIDNIYNNNIPKHPFDLNHIFHTPYNPYKLQNEYFIINSFDDLFNSLENIESTLIESLSRLTPEEEYQLRVEFNNTVVEYPKEKTVIDLFYEQSSNTPDAIAVMFGEKYLTYKELNDRSNQLAHYLKCKGVKEETLVPISIERSIEMIIGILGIMKAGGAYVPIDPALPIDRMEYMIENTEANIIVSNSLCKSKLPAGAQDIIELDGDWEIIEKESKKIPENSVRPGQLAYVIYTSGTTGKPKGVLIEHSGLVNVCMDHIKEFSMTGADRYLQFMSPSFDGSILDIFSTLLSGASLILPAKEVLSNSENFIQFITKHKITIFTITPSFLSILHKHELPGVRTIISAGEAAILEDAMYYGSFKNFYNGYGPSEVTVNATLFKITNSKEYTTIPIGKPRSNKSIYILNNEMDLCPIGVEGEMYIAGIGLARGYLKQPELTGEKFIADPFSKEPSSRMYKTGDIGRWLSDGNIEFLGRQDDQVKINGYRIELGEIEAVIQRSDLVRQAVVLAIEDNNNNKRLVAYIVTDGLFDRDAILCYLKGWLPEYMIPGFWVELENFPLTPNGKIDKRALPEFIIKDQLSNQYIAPRNETERELVRIWQQILEVERVGIYDDFFELGGHSLLAIKLIMAIRNELAVELSIGDLFEHTTIESLAGQLSQFSKKILPAIKKQLRPDRIPLSFSQERLWFIDQLDGSLQYHIPMVFRLHGELNRDALNFAFTTIIDRHEILRSVILDHEGEFYQYINNKDSWKLSIVAGSQYQHDPNGLQQYITSLIKKPFDLSKDYMLRTDLITIKEQEHVLVITMHHIASDGWSLSIFVKELAELYTSYTQDEPVQLQPLEIQYADFALWQHRYLQGELLDNKINYWKQKLNGVAPLHLPADHSRPAVLTSKGAVALFNIDKKLSEELQQLSHRQATTLFMTCLAAFKVLLYRYSGQQDICVGIPIANRMQQEVEGLIGFFVNTLALRSEVKSETSFTELLEQVKATTKEAYEHQDLSLEKVVEVVVNERDLSRSPLFQVMFVLQNTPEIPQLNLGNLVFTTEEYIYDISKFDLSFFITETPNGLQLSVEYSTDLYAEHTIIRMISHYNELLGSIVKEPEQKLGLLSMLTPQEEHQLLVE